MKELKYCLVLLSLIIGPIVIASGFGWLPILEKKVSPIVPKTYFKQTEVLENRIKTLEALYMALNERVDSVKNRPDMIIHKAYITNEKGKITVDCKKGDVEWEKKKKKSERLK